MQFSNSEIEKIENWIIGNSIEFSRQEIQKMISSKKIIQKSSGVVYRGMCVIREEFDELSVADWIEQIREFNSWTTSKEQAEFFAQLALDNTEFDDCIAVVLCAKINENSECLFIDAYDNGIYSLNKSLQEYVLEEEVLQCGKRIRIHDIFIVGSN